MPVSLDKSVLSAELHVLRYEISAPTLDIFPLRLSTSSSVPLFYEDSTCDYVRLSYLLNRLQQFQNCAARLQAHKDPANLVSVIHWRPVLVPTLCFRDLLLF